MKLIIKVKLVPFAKKIVSKAMYMMEQATERNGSSALQKRFNQETNGNTVTRSDFSVEIKDKVRRLKVLRYI